MQHRVDLVLDRVRRLHQLPRRREISRRSARVSLVADPDAGTRSGGEQLGQHARVELVGLDLRVADRPQPLGLREHHLGDMRREDPRDRQRVARRLEHHPIVGAELCANSSSCVRRVATRPADRAGPPSVIATSQKSRWTSNPMYLLIDLSHLD